ncbi:unnamed protein product [Pseudo-nitzschia multistriata]|uniref:ATPase V1 complex subunit H C-terminal domain-containing protein n=1 Tax=Pseudo-nitzschia multistriata TaxID=183589 RepID=A0A448ZPW0_9STRA|nr:unnamed protein product [Pseudo-nitzschia multistriata]
MVFYPVLSPSPVEKAFCFVTLQQQDAIQIQIQVGGRGIRNIDSQGFRDPTDEEEEGSDGNLPPFWLSPPEWSLLKSAEENPLEYTLAERDEAVSYLRLLLKMLGQVTGGSTSRDNAKPNTVADATAGSNEDSGIATLESPPLETQDEALDFYYRSTKQHKKLVVSHYCVDKLFEIIAVSLDNASNGIPSLSKLFHGVDENEIQKMNEIQKIIESCHANSARSNNLDIDEWRMLVPLLYNRSVDEYTKRGAALILSYILKTGCERIELLRSCNASHDNRKKNNSNNNNNKPSTWQETDVDFLNLLSFPDEHKAATFSKSNSPEEELTTVLDQTNLQRAIDESLGSFVSWLTGRLQCSDHYLSLGVVTPTLGVLLSGTKRARTAFHQAGGIGYLVRHLKAKRTTRTPSKWSGGEDDWFRRPATKVGPAANSTSPGSLTARTILAFSKPKSSPPHSQLPASPERKRGNVRSRKTNPSTSTSLSINAYSHSDSFSVSSSFSSTNSNSIFNHLGSPSSPGATESETHHTEALVESDTNHTHLQGFISRAGEALSGPSVLAATLAATSTIAASSSLLSPAQALQLPHPDRISRKRPVSSSSVQQVYDLVFCLWCMSMDCQTDESVANHFARDGAVSALAHLLKTAPREKVLRLTLACLRSLTTLPASHSRVGGDKTSDIDANSFVREMIGCGVLKSLDTVRLRRWNDEDLEDDLEFLHGFLSDRTEQLSQFHVYEAEVETGALRWDDRFHTKDFFRRNVGQMEGRDGRFGVVKSLVQILYASTKSGRLRSSGGTVVYAGLNEVGGDSWGEDDISDDEVCECLAVCLFDLGEFVRHYPNGKHVLDKVLGAKPLVMCYVNHPRWEVREQALLCASKILVNNWRSIEI